MGEGFGEGLGEGLGDGFRDIPGEYLGEHPYYFLSKAWTVG